MAKPEYYYGVHSVESLLELEPERVLTLFTLKGRDDQRLQKILELAEPFGISVQKASRDSLEKLAGLPFHQGVVAAVRPHPTLNEKDLDALLQADSKPLLLALDQVTDPHNLGACIRTAAAMGVTAVIVPRDRSASLTPTARKVAAGGAEKVKFIQVTNLARTLAHLKQEFNVRVVGTMLDEKALPIQQFDFTGTAVCVVMGAEDTGLRPITQSQCDQTVFIPMAGNLQSLNVSVATGMALYEACRQRQA
ncbi:MULTISPECIES: 23S rRNA (guanosine(2251)-2'-O)-methyltransferase RlmB [Acinetobacter]|jgi:23S rRNA (guanosine2251-2'-O)-methyltransferase|uniref:23S rRNA (guanosine-2'-O-)-methyltransferase RlmB n=1 Tax=Acinetobacter towneri TaxID=202956 RepID=A0AB35M4D2_9GAMM|nr:MULTISPECIES: 23S rRNA (guanosine(2251)-2'-O)-methyltransferase RlmB [Acinetobacter]GIT82856.1 23S rRNA (guanosine-2'-O-)-methyltransferase RlmB [Acinetobacter seohaensis]AVH50133.1 23S rRNA (guanosine(2251)-2'-O)-methyltransferase RlmB [Acinetobacter sp. SWBY1]ENV68691.1 23S rRNA (guanosine-2'-O-)-methyltransferase RlmB [Acinetobacter towneri DSM 14962 = CIP 107472]MCA4778738.1 23S rRNA (guanosine(2251)-2'-O)-methyltransferase RlmB [Acinetobacter towneri]MCA4784066.1 23S rRNA (guanosine(22